MKIPEQRATKKIVNVRQTEHNYDTKLEATKISKKKSVAANIYLVAAIVIFTVVTKTPFT